MRVNLDFTATKISLLLVRRCALAICDGKIHQSGGLWVKDGSAAFSMLFCPWGTLPTDVSSRQPHKPM
jgi:hypothetical protein